MHDTANQSKEYSRTGDICTAMIRIGMRMAAVFDQKFAEWATTQAQLRTLIVICDVGGEAGISPSDLANYLLLDRATVTSVTARLVGEGLVERLPGVNRRTFQLRVTPKGLSKVREVTPVATRFADFTLEDFSDGEQEMFLTLLQRLENRVRSIDPKTPLSVHVKEETK